MSMVVKGFRLCWNQHEPTTEIADVDLATSQAVGVWLVAGNDDRGCATAFRMVVGRHTAQDAARAYAAQRKSNGHPIPTAYLVFPLLSDEPIAEDRLGDNYEETWSAFSDAWIEVRL